MIGRASVTEVAKAFRQVTVAVAVLVLLGCSIFGRGHEEAAAPPASAPAPSWPPAHAAPGLPPLGPVTDGTETDVTLASRGFAGPHQYPPTDFAAYGIVAFTSRAMPEDRPRYEMICDAYVASLPSYTELSTPIESQMVTIWPITSDSEADRINRNTRDAHETCNEAVNSYGLVTALKAIEYAKRSGSELNGSGPFLLAWSPSGKMGQPDALVLVSNLSEITTSDQAKEVFVKWSHDIVENPDLWNKGKGWNLEKLKITIRLWADKWGPKILEIFGAKG